ncbi:tetratricopeptide repeat protein [Leminorella grimontii]|uniref:tetratricopeptide repeat protein n=1 Tax=Leminorella grimontii TaxID=82981 RepID=UPI00321FA81E
MEHRNVIKGNEVKRLIQLLCVLFTVSIAACVVGQDEFSSLRLQADSGDIDAQRNLGILYLKQEERSASDKQRAVAWLKNAAEGGDTIAQGYMGYLYINGIGVERNKEKSIEWYKKSAVRGDISAQYALGMLFERDREDLSNYWLNQAARRGDPKSQVTLALKFKNGTGADSTGLRRVDNTKTFFWAQKAALADYGSAQFFVGDMYASGDGIPQNSVLAGAWLMVAAEKDRPASIVTASKNSVVNSLTPDQKKQAERLFKQYKQAIKDNEQTLNQRFAKLIPVTEPDPEANFKIMQAQAEGGDIQSMVRLGLMYGNEIGVEKNYPLAMKWFSAAAEKGDAEAQYYLAYGYYHGMSVAIDKDKGNKYFALAAQGGEKYSLNYMGGRFRDGEGGAKNLPLAFSYFKRSAIQGVANAQYNLAECYLKGIGTKADPQAAYVWFSLASAFGRDSAMVQRDNLSRQLKPLVLEQAQREAQELFDQIFKPDPDI